MIDFENIEWQGLDYTIMCVVGHLEMEEDSLEKLRFEEMLYLGLFYKYFLDFEDELIPFDVVGVIEELEAHGIPSEYLLNGLEVSKDVKKLDLNSDDPSYPTTHIKQMLRLERCSLPELRINHFKKWSRTFAPGAKFYSIPARYLVEQDESSLRLLAEPIEEPTEEQKRLGLDFFNLDWKKNSRIRKDKQ